MHVFKTEICICGNGWGYEFGANIIEGLNNGMKHCYKIIKCVLLMMSADVEWLFIPDHTQVWIVYGNAWKMFKMCDMELYLIDNIQMFKSKTWFLCVRPGRWIPCFFEWA